MVGDTHLPFEHCDYLNFCVAVSNHFKCEIAIHVGDEIDYHAISFHDSDSELFSAGQELDLSIEKISLWKKEFPKLTLLESNHGSLVLRKMKHHGIPIRTLKSQQELYDVPNWMWYHDILLKTKYGNVYGCHGKASGYGALARDQGCSSFQGHYHGKFEVTWHQRVEHRRFNMFVGCGINWESLAFAYGKNNLQKPILGCAVIDEDGMPHLFKMRLDNNGRWDGKI